MILGVFFILRTRQVIKNVRLRRRLTIGGCHADGATEGCPALRFNLNNVVRLPHPLPLIGIHIRSEPARRHHADVSNRSILTRAIAQDCCQFNFRDRQGRSCCSWRGSCVGCLRGMRDGRHKYFLSTKEILTRQTIPLLQLCCIQAIALRDAEHRLALLHSVDHPTRLNRAGC